MRQRLEASQPAGAFGVWNCVPVQNAPEQRRLQIIPHASLMLPRIGASHRRSSMQQPLALQGAHKFPEAHRLHSAIAESLAVVTCEARHVALRKMDSELGLS
eukprot:scaffold14040_cov31-Tisochrysis_lutea.AAC.3